MIFYYTKAVVKVIVFAPNVGHLLYTDCEVLTIC